MRNKLNLSVLAVAVCALSSNAYADNQAESKNPASYLNKDVVAGSWKQLKGKIQQKWAKLTNDDVLKMKGTATELEGILQQKYGYTKEEAEKSIQEFLEENKTDLMSDESQ